MPIRMPLPWVKELIVRGARPRPPSVVTNDPDCKSMSSAVMTKAREVVERVTDDVMVSVPVDALTETAVDLVVTLVCIDNPRPLTFAKMPLLKIDGTVSNNNDGEDAEAAVNPRTPIVALLESFIPTTVI